MLVLLFGGREEVGDDGTFPVSIINFLKTHKMCLLLLLHVKLINKEHFKTNFSLFKKLIIYKNT